jgi:hypothetical protein
LAAVVLTACVTREIALRVDVPVEESDLPVEGLTTGRSQPQFLRNLTPLLGSDVVKLEWYAEDGFIGGTTNRCEVAFANLGIVPAPECGDRCQCQIIDVGFDGY